MLHALSQLIVRLADLAEAEGRLARRQVYKLAIAILVSAGAIALSTLSVAGIFVALFLGLHSAIGGNGAAALAISCALLLAIGMIALFVARSWLATEHTRS